jgi:glycerol-3-phosphate acyltransferase PlsY
MNTLLFTLAAYLIGSVSFAVVVSKLFGLSDPRTYGSKNPGATNVLRSGNKKAAVLTLVGDGFKGWLAVWLAYKFGPRFGGKGVATALGILLALNVWLGLATMATWLVIAFAFRYSSLAALIAALFAPFYYGLLFGSESGILLSVVAMSVLLIYRHRKNIFNLMAGKESRIGSKKK